MSDALPQWLVAMNLWTAALLAIAIALDLLLVRRVRAAWRIGLYATVGLRLVLPADWHSPLGALREASPAAASVTAIEPSLLVLGSPIQSEVVGTLPIVHRAGAAPMPALGDALVSIWLVVAAVLLAIFVLRQGALARELARGEPARPQVRARAREATVLEHASLGPLTCGVLRPCIVLPRGWVDRLDAQALGHVLAHELAHVARRDTLLVAAIAVVCAVIWPVLPLWLAAARVRVLIERAADERALAGAAATERIAFGHTLVRMAGVPVERAGALAIGGYRDLRGRIRALRAGPPWPALAQLPLLGAAIAVPVACAGLGDASPGCRELATAASTAHDRVEAGERAQAEVALDAYDTFAAHCAGDPEYADLAYYRAELLWSIAHDQQQNAEDSRVAFGMAHQAFLEALAAGTKRFETDAATGQMFSKRTELWLAPEPVVAPPPEPEGTVFVDRSETTIHERPVTDYTDDELALLASYDVFEAHVEPTHRDLAGVLLHRATLAVSHHRFDDARAPLERLLATNGDSLTHLRGAEMLVDVHTIAMTDPDADDEAKRGAAAELLELCDRLPTLALWDHEEAYRLHRALSTLRPATLGHAG